MAQATLCGNSLASVTVLVLPNPGAAKRRVRALTRPSGDPLPEERVSRGGDSPLGAARGYWWGSAFMSVMGRVLRRTSPRSLENLRIAATCTGKSEVKLNVPSKSIGPLYGSSLRNLSICPFAGMVKVPDPALAVSLRNEN